MICCKRVYQSVSPEDGQRVLVDRLWPRNMRKDALHGQWLRDVAPSDALRRAFHAGDLDFAGFSEHYRAELAAHPEHWYPLLDLAAKGTLTLLFAGKDTAHNNAQVLADWLEEELDRREPGSSPVCYAQEPGG